MSKEGFLDDDTKHAFKVAAFPGSLFILGVVGTALAAQHVEGPHRQTGIEGVEPISNTILNIDANRHLEFSPSGATLYQKIGNLTFSGSYTGEYSKSVPFAPDPKKQIVGSHTVERYAGFETNTTLSDVECDATTQELTGDINYRVDMATISDQYGQIDEEMTDQMQLVLGPARYSEVQTIEDAPLGSCLAPESFAIHSGTLDLNFHSYRVIS